MNVQVVGGVCGAGICLGFVAIIIVVIIGVARASKGSALRKDTATPINAERQYVEFLGALDAVGAKYKLKAIARPDSLSSLTASCVGKKECVLLKGKTRGRELSVSAIMAGDALVTRIDVSGKYALSIDVTVKSLLHVQGLGMDLRYMGGKPVVDDKLTIRPESEPLSQKTKDALTPAVLANMEKLVFLKPKTMNLSSQAVEFYEKKFTIYKDRASLRDYGLIRDKNYAAGLMKLFMNVAADWEKKG